MSWRLRVLIGVLVGTSLAYLALVYGAPARTHTSLALLAGVFVVGITATAIYKRRQLTWGVFTANLALGAIVHLALAGLVLLGDRMWRLGLVPTLTRDWAKFLVGALAIGAASFTWTRARGAREEPAEAMPHGEPEPAPPAVDVLEAAPAWRSLEASLTSAEHRRQLRALERLDQTLRKQTPEADRVDEARRIVAQEALRLETSAGARETDDEDVLSQVASLLEWGAQKLPELADLDVSDLLMAKAVADIRSQRSRVEHRFVDHRSLRAIHPIDRPTAEAKAEERARAAREALPLLRAHGMRLSEALIAAHEELAPFQSVTGFQVVELPDDGGYVTFEGNGRREALHRAFGDDEVIEVEVRVYLFDDPRTRDKIHRRVERVRRYKGVVDEEADGTPRSDPAPHDRGATG